MKKISVIIVLLILIPLVSYNKKGIGRQLSSGNNFLNDLPDVKKFRMKNGINIMYLEDNLPVTVIYTSVSYGKLYENAANAGISDLMVKTLQISGSSEYPGNSLYRKLESIGGNIQISAGWETTEVAIKVLSKYSDLAFHILGDILINPAFDEAGLNSAKKLLLEQIRRDKDRPEEAGVLKLREIIFGGSGYGAVPGEKTISGIDLTAVKQLWKKHVTGKNINLAVSSILPDSEIHKLAEKEFSSIITGTRDDYSLNNGKILSDLKSSSGNIYLIPRDLEQATVYAGTLSPDIRYEGNYALFIMNYILGGGSFNSRLMNEIRVKRGLAYSVFSIVRNRRNTGVFISFVQTRKETVAEVISLMNKNFMKMYTEPLTGEELKWAKDSIKNSYVFRFNNIEDILGNYLEMEYNGLDENYFRNYLNNINNVTASEVLKESGKLFRQGIVIVVVGKKTLENELSSYGKVVICE